MGLPGFLKKNKHVKRLGIQLVDDVKMIPEYPLGDCTHFKYSRSYGIKDRHSTVMQVHKFETLRSCAFGSDPIVAAINHVNFMKILSKADLAPVIHACFMDDESVAIVMDTCNEGSITNSIYLNMSDFELGDSLNLVISKMSDAGVLVANPTADCFGIHAPDGYPDNDTIIKFTGDNMPCLVMKEKYRDDSAACATLVQLLFHLNENTSYGMSGTDLSIIIRREMRSESMLRQVESILGGDEVYGEFARVLSINAQKIKSPTNGTLEPYEMIQIATRKY